MQGAEFYKDRPPYAFEFNSEMPFYHASCIALNAATPREKKIGAIEALEAIYGSSADIIFGLVLAYLENGRLDEALGVASEYYLSGVPHGPIAATRTLQSIYAGQMTVLCSIKPSELCTRRLERFRAVHPEANPNTGSGHWGREATLMMARRGGLL